MRAGVLVVAVCGVVILSLAGACSSEPPLPPVHASEPRDVSLVQLIANPAEWHGRPVRVIGFCRLEFEGNALYLHEVDFERGISKNGVWLQVGWPVPEKFRGASDEYAIVEATFDGDEQGHMGLFAGTLKDVTRLDRWPSQKEFERSDRLTPRTPSAVAPEGSR